MEEGYCTKGEIKASKNLNRNKNLSPYALMWGQIGEENTCTVHSISHSTKSDSSAAASENCSALLFFVCFWQVIGTFLPDLLLNACCK